MKSRWFSLPLVSFLASCGTHEGAAGAEGPGGDPTTSDGGGKDASAASEDDAGSGGGNDLDAHPAEDAGEPDEGADAGDGAGSEDPDAAACTGAARTTATAADFVGDWSAGDYPSDFSGGNYLSISGVAGQMGNARQYAVHVPTGYRKDTAYPALFCFHGLAQNAAMFCLDTGVEWDEESRSSGLRRHHAERLHEQLERRHLLRQRGLGRPRRRGARAGHLRGGEPAPEPGSPQGLCDRPLEWRVPELPPGVRSVRPVRRGGPHRGGHRHRGDRPGARRPPPT